MNHFAVRVDGQWYETMAHKEDSENTGILFYILHDGTEGEAKPGDWKPLEQALLQDDVKVKRIP